MTVNVTGMTCVFAPAFTRIDRVEPADIPPKNVIDTSRSWWFATVKVRVAVPMLPSASAADHVTLEVPIGKTPPTGHVVAVVVSGYVIANVVATLPLRQLRRPLLLGCLAVASLGYAIPGTVLALGLMAPLVAIDESINALTLAVSGAQVGLLLAGSSAALVVAYTVRFASMSIGFVQAGLATLPLDLDHAARLAGAGPLRILRDLHLPLLRPALAAAALLVFVDCLKELPMTLLMRPLNLETLSTSIYQHATRGSFEEGALAALLIVAAGIFPVVLLIRLADAAEIPRPSKGHRGRPGWRRRGRWYSPTAPLS